MQSSKSIRNLQRNKGTSRERSNTRPPSIAHLKKLVLGEEPSASRYSSSADRPFLEEPPPMTELEFWAALVQDYPSTATRLPTLTTTKIRSGIPPPLRGVVWSSMSGARSRRLEHAFERLQHESSPYEGIINKDVGRSFPGVELFRDADGEGQRMLGRVLKCFSLHDKEIGYCQGLGFLVGPLLMNMGEKDAFLRACQVSPPSRSTYYPLLIYFQAHGALCVTTLIFTIAGWSAHAHFPIQYPSKAASSRARRAFERSRSRACISFAMVSILFRSHMSVIHALPDLRRHLRRRRKRDSDASRTFAIQAQRGEDNGQSRVRGSHATVTWPLVVGLLWFQCG